MPGHQPPHPHDGQRYTTIITFIPTTDKTPFGTFPSYLVARLDVLKTTRGISQFEAYGKYAEFVEGDGDGDEPEEIGPIGSAVNLSAGTLRDILVGLLGTENWNEMKAVATCSLDVRTA